VVRARTLISLAALMTLLGPGRSLAGHAGPNYCGVDIPEDEALGMVGLPTGDVFCPLLADPKSSGSFASWERVSNDSKFGSDIGSIGIADRFGLVRWGGPVAGDGFQLGVDGGIYAQFDLASASYDLINADYTVGLPATFRRDRFSARVRVYHQSSHLGDEFLLRADHPERENLSFQSVEAILSVDMAVLRLYGGGEYLFNQQPERLKAHVVHGGLELRQRNPVPGTGGMHLVAAADVKALEREDWKVGYSARAGFEFSRSRESTHVARRWMLLAEYYHGASPYGQFFRDQIEYAGLGIHFSP
jgi:uncharacterized protein DUF1207